MNTFARLLILTDTPSPREVILQRDAAELGREAGNDLLLAGAGVSRHHARLQLRPEGWLLEDLRSANGTFVNGQRVSAVWLRHGDLVQVGEHRLQFLLGAAPPPLPQAAAALWPPPLPQALPPPLSRARPARDRRAGSGHGFVWALVGGGGGLLLLGGILLVVVKNRPSAPAPAQAVEIKSPLVQPALPVPQLPAVATQDAGAVLDALGARFKAADVEGVLALSHPAMKEEFRQVFTGHPERMNRAAVLLATRKPVIVAGDLAEFEVVEGERRFAITLERVGTGWTLRSL